MSKLATNTTDTLSTIKMLAEAGASNAGALLPVLHSIQDAIGFIPPDSIAIIADTFNVSRAEVHGVITFYPHFRSTSPSKHTIHICRAEACQSMGAEQLITHAERTLKCKMHETSSDGAFSLDPVYCLGHCATSPVIMIDEAVHARITTTRLDALIEKAKESA